MNHLENQRKSGDDLQLRTATIADADSLVRLINAAFVVEQIAIAGDRIDRLGVEKYLSTGRFLLLERGAALSGCVYVEKRGERGYLGLLSVDPAWQKLGLGGQLVRASEEYFRQEGCAGVDLRVISARSELLPFYEKLGYRVTGTSAMPAHAALKVPCHFIHLAKSLR